MRRIRNWPFIFLLATGGLVTLIVAVVGLQSMQSKKLRNAARQIQVGDNIAEVDVLLGGSKYGYETGWPAAGAPPTRFGAMYGGSVNSLHEEFDAFVGRSVFRNRWQNGNLSQDAMEWPVLITYNRDRRVTAVYIDGIRNTSAK